MQDLQKKTVKELREIAKGFQIPSLFKWKKDELIEKIEQENQKLQEKNNHKLQIKAQGILDLHQDGYGFLRSNNFESTEDDFYVGPTQVRRFRLKTGDYLEGVTRVKKEGEKFAPLIYIHKINGEEPDKVKSRIDFEKLTPIFPIERFRLEYKNCPLSNRIIDLLAPIGKGQRGLIVSSPKTGKTTLIKSIARAIEKNHPEVIMMVLLIDERPEEVTDIERSMHAQVIASTFDQEPENHIRLSELVLERAKRMVEQGEDVVLLLDSITRLTRAYNLVSPSSGKLLSGGIDPTAFYKPKRFLGAARKMEEKGSLTILATALVDTGSRMDDVIFEEFKGTGNMEIHLNRDLSELRIFPAIDIYKSGTRKDELLLSKREYETMSNLRRKLQGEQSVRIAFDVLKTFDNTKNNEELVDSLSKMIDS